MQKLSDLFGIWLDTNEMAFAIGAKPDTVRKWKKFSRIPQDQWMPVIKAAMARGHIVTGDDLMRMNAPMKRRGRPAHKAKRSSARRSVITTSAA